MEEEKKYTKVKIFLFLVFAIFAVFLIASVVRIIQDLFLGINEKGDEFRCTDFTYSINEKSMSFNEKSLVFELINQDYDINISKITLITDSGERIFTPEKESRGGNSIFVRFENISIGQDFLVRINDCNNTKKFTMRT